MSIGRSKAKIYVEHSTGVSFDDVAGIDEARAELMEIVDFLKNPPALPATGRQDSEGRSPRGRAGHGQDAPGQGRWPARPRCRFFSLSGSDFIEMFVASAPPRVRDLFEQAQAQGAQHRLHRRAGRASAKARGIAPGFGGHDEREQTLNQLLAELDGFDSSKGVIIMAATNRPEILDPALLRPGRFDRKVVVDRPDLKGREMILRVHTRGVTPGARCGPHGHCGNARPGFVGADLANLVNEAALGAARADKDAVEMADFDEAIDRVVGRARAPVPD